MLEILIANHCAPAMAGIKPSSIVTCRKSDVPNLNEELEYLNAQLNASDIYISVLCECKTYAIVIVYRKSVLEKHLHNYNNRAFLRQFGYLTECGVGEYLNALSEKLKCEKFPHEIGVFLGYPLRDIYSFINHRDEGCIMVGEWKVYHNPEEAKKLFHRFNACKRNVAKKVSEGISLSRIFCTV